MSSLACPACGGTAFDAIVEYGSYLLRCARCGENAVATSFMALRDETGSFRAYLDPGAGAEPSPAQQVAQGPLYTIHARVGSIAASGQRVLLVPHPSPTEASEPAP